MRNVNKGVEREIDVSLHYPNEIGTTFDVRDDIHQVLFHGYFQYSKTDF